MLLDKTVQINWLSEHIKSQTSKSLKKSSLHVNKQHNTASDYHDERLVTLPPSTAAAKHIHAKKRKRKGEAHKTGHISPQTQIEYEIMFCVNKKLRLS